MTLWLFTKINSLIPLLYLDSCIYCSIFEIFNKLKDFLRSLNGESGRASHLVYKFDKQIARCNNSHKKILNLLELPHVLTAYASKPELQMTD